MRVLNRSLTVLFAAISTLGLSGCLGTDTPPPLFSYIYESTSGTGYVAVRGAGYDDIQTTAAGDAGTIGTGSNAALTAFTDAGTGASGFTMLMPADTVNGTAQTATLNNGAFSTVTGATNVFVGAQESSTVTPITTNNSGTGTPTGDVILVDKFGTSKSLQDSEYGVWTETGATASAGLSNTTATTAGVFAIGIPTAIMPASGSATYTGGAAGVATNATGGGEFAGVAKLSANFGTGVITGTISGSSTDTTTLIPLAPAGSTTASGSINPISFTAGTIAGNTFTGTASAVAPGAGSPTVDISGSSGTFGGQFNGFNAAEAAGTFKLSGGGNTAAVVGSFGAKQP